MDRETLKRLEEKLRRLHGDLGSEIKHVNGELRKGLDHNAEEALADREEADILEAEGRLEEKEIRLVEEALERMRAGVYGMCLECGADINIERLKAVPYAKYCVKCQDEMEKK